MKLLVGLGNPEKRYANNRHNVGFMVVDAVCDNLGFSDFVRKEKFKADVSEGEVIGEKIFLMKPGTYMNLSSDSVFLIQNFYKIPTKDIWVFYDDVDLPLGTLRLRESGSGGTHNGMKSLVKLLGEDFTRFRVGVEGRNENTRKLQDLSSYVLSDFRDEEMEVLRASVSRCVLCARFALSHGIAETKEKFGI